MPLGKCLLKPVLCSLIYLLLGTGFVVADEIDDASLFVEAFSAYQNKDYLLTIDKIETLTQLFPESPLQDITLLMLARAALKSGDYELAAKTVNHFNGEYTTSPLNTTVDEELRNLGSRKLRGETLPANILLFAAAQKIRNESLTSARSAPRKAEQERQDHKGSNLELIAVKKTHDVQNGEDQRPAENTVRDSIRSVLSIVSNDKVVEVGKGGLVQFELANIGITSEDYMVQVIAPGEYGAALVQGGTTRVTSTNVSIGTDTPYKGTVSYRVPGDTVDGHKGTITLRAVSLRYKEDVQSRDAHFTAVSPMVRVVVKPWDKKLPSGEQTRFRITLINAGSLPAQALTIRVSLPPQTEFLDAPGVEYRQEAPGVITFALKSLPSGRLEEFWIDVRINKDCQTGLELRCRVEVINPNQKTRETFTSSALTVEAHQPL